MTDFIGFAWRLLGTDQGKLLAGFVLTTIAGGALAFLFQSLSWRRQVRLDLFRQRYADGWTLLEQVSSMVDRRYFRLQRLVWVIADGGTSEKIETREREYFEAVVEWNEKLRSVHNRVRLLIGEEEALQFLDYADDFRQDDPVSLHYRFVKAHRAVLQAKSDPTKASAAKEEVDRLNWGVSRFAYDTTTLFMMRASSLALLRSASPQGAAVKARQTSGPAELRHPGTGRDDVHAA